MHFHAGGGSFERRVLVMKPAKSYTHFTLEERFLIELKLNDLVPISEIALILKRPYASVSREIIRNSRIQSYRYKYSGKFHRPCAHINDCTRLNVCKKRCNRYLCSKCKHINCTSECEDFEEIGCIRLKVKSRVCNGCAQRAHCSLTKRLYQAKWADNLACAKDVEAKSGLRVDKEEFSLMLEVIREGLMQGKSLHHICSEYKSFPYSERSIYRLISLGKCSPTLISIDLPKAVKYSMRKKHEEKVVFQIPYRSYADYLSLDETKRQWCIQMDSVEPRKGCTKVILTFLVVPWKLLLGFVIDKKDPMCVKQKLDELERALGFECFSSYFEDILTDRKVEFSKYLELEHSVIYPRRQRAHIYYCDPRAPQQKGALEKYFLKVLLLII